MTSIKPGKPEAFAGHCHALMVNTWLYQVQTSPGLAFLGNAQGALNGTENIAFVSTLLKDNATRLWFMMIQSGQPTKE